MSDFIKDIKKDILKRLEYELKTVPKEELGNVMFKIILNSDEFLNKDDIDKLKEIFNKRLKELV